MTPSGGNGRRPAKAAKPTASKAKPAAGAKKPAAKKLTVAVTGPTGEIGKPFIARARALAEVGADHRRWRGAPFDPRAHGWKQDRVPQGDVLDRAPSTRSSTGADVVVHLAFIIIAGADESHEHQPRRARATSSRRPPPRGVKRLVYTSSVAAYGFHAG